jgi:hypothetical protein
MYSAEECPACLSHALTTGQEPTEVGGAFRGGLRGQMRQQRQRQRGSGGRASRNAVQDHGWKVPLYPEPEGITMPKH